MRDITKPAYVLPWSENPFRTYLITINQSILAAVGNDTLMDGITFGGGLRDGEYGVPVLFFASIFFHGGLRAASPCISIVS